MEFKEPILLLTYKRPETTIKVLKKILSVKPKKIYVFQDGPKKEFKRRDNLLYLKTTNIIRKIKKKQKKTKINFFQFKKNIGQRYIAKKVMDIVFKSENKIIFLEDDTYPDRSFFYYCSLMLNKFKNDDDIYHISGCNLYYGMYKRKISNQLVFKSKYPHLWGWATWKSKWEKYYNPNIVDWDSNKKKFLSNRINNKDEYRFFNYFISKNAKKIHTGWDIPWIYKLILNKKYTLVPNINLIKNIGYEYDPSGKGAKKFRNLSISKINFKSKFQFKIYNNKLYDDFLRLSFYGRKNILILIFKKINRFLKSFFI